MMEEEELMLLLFFMLKIRSIFPDRSLRAEMRNKLHLKCMCMEKTQIRTYFDRF